MPSNKYEPKKAKWRKLYEAVDDFLEVRSKNGMVPADAPEITELINRHWDCRNLVLEEKK